MTKDYLSDGVLVYDRYYCTKPNTPLLVIKRILLAAAFCVCSMVFLLGQYRLPVSVPAMAAVCAASCIGFSVLFIFVKKRYVLPALFLTAGLIAWWNLEPLLERLSYFADACIMLVDGRFVSPAPYLFHYIDDLTELNSGYTGGVIFGTAAVCVLYGLIVSACTSGKLVPVIPGLLFTAMCVPGLIAEKLEFSLWLVPALAAFAGLCAIRKNYSNGIAVHGGSSGDLRRHIRREERSFLRNISGSPSKKRTQMRCNYYSKYFSTGMYCAALTAVCLLTGSAIIPAGGSIDYKPVYNFFVGLVSETPGTQSPFDDGTASDYFTHTGNEQQDMLNIISPGTGSREIIRVDYTGNRPVYLRGDIGIDFTGKSWTTAVGSEPEQWRLSGLKDSYRPCESRVIAALLSATESGSSGTLRGADGEAVITASDISIEYLCDTDVVFLPPYTAEFSFYNSDSFDVYSDYAVRVSESAGSHINSVQCTALLPSYMSNESYSGDPAAFAGVEAAFADAMCAPNDIYSTVVPEMTAPDILAEYERFVEQTYSGVPGDYGQRIDDFIRSKLEEIISSVSGRYSSGLISTAQYRYDTAAAVAEYLRTNYTYTLDTEPSADPVMKFLNETKRGHCALYASSLTLILRQLGIPARYCTGFYVEGENGSHSVVLREKNLHAWVEVYTGQLGWVTFDPTSSAAYPGRNNGAASVSSEETVKPHTEEPVSEDTPSTETPTAEVENVTTVHAPTEQPVTAETTDVSEVETAQPPSFLEVIAPFLPVAAAVMIISGIAVFILVKLHQLKKSARGSMSRLKRSGTASSRRIYTLVLTLLDYRGISPGKGEMPQEFWRRADNEFGTSFEDDLSLLEAMEFGEHEVSDSEHAQLYSQLERIIAKIRPFGFPGNVQVLRIIKNCSKKSGKL